MPLTFLYCLIQYLKNLFTNQTNFAIKIISVGNLIIGGTGKTPTVITLAKRYSKKFKTVIILRGYGRKSKGLYFVSKNGKILVDVNISGDEAMLMAISIPNSNIIVSEDRVKAINIAKKLGYKLIILDDGFSKKNIKKIDIVLKPKDTPANSFCLPSGVYRESIKNYKKADIILQEEIDYKRVVNIKNPTKNMVMVTSISRPERVFNYIPKYKLYRFKDHSYFTKNQLEKILKENNATSLLIATKDYVKLKDFNLPISIIELDIKISETYLKKIDKFK